MQLTSRVSHLEKAKQLATLDKKYDNALNIVSRLLKLNGNDIDALRLMGNILDLKEMDNYNKSSLKNYSRPELENAKKYYDDILRLDPDNTLALIDIGNYWERRGDYKASLEHYNKVISLLNQGHYYLSLEDEYEEVFFNKALLLKSMGRIDDYSQTLKEGLLHCSESTLLKSLLDET